MVPNFLGQNRGREPAAWMSSEVRRHTSTRSLQIVTTDALLLEERASSRGIARNYARAQARGKAHENTEHNCCKLSHEVAYSCQVGRDSIDGRESAPLDL